VSTSQANSMIISIDFAKARAWNSTQSNAYTGYWVRKYYYWSFNTHAT